MSLKVVYLYMCQGNAPLEQNVKWDTGKPCADRYVKNMKDDGTFIMLSKLKQSGVIDDALVFYESARGAGFADWGLGIHGWVCPQVTFIKNFIDKDTIIYVRGGFRSWHNFLLSHKDRNWLMTYNANTGRQKWTFWDIVLWDLESDYTLDRWGRFWYYYKKPVADRIFYPFNSKPVYDVCIGASHIHDKKGQWRAINILIEHKKKYGNIKAVLPGYGSRGQETSKIANKIKDHSLDVTATGMLDRSRLSKDVFNRSKLGLFLTTHGQGDRGPIEALATGLPLIIGSRRYHSPDVCDNRYSDVVEDINDFSAMADLVNLRLQHLHDRRYVRKLFEENLGFDVCYQNIKFIFDFIRDNPKPTLLAKRGLLEQCTRKDNHIKNLGT